MSVMEMMRMEMVGRGMLLVLLLLFPVVVVLAVMKPGDPTPTWSYHTLPPLPPPWSRGSSVTTLTLLLGTVPPRIPWRSTGNLRGSPNLLRRSSSSASSRRWVWRWRRMRRMTTVWKTTLEGLRVEMGMMRTTTATKTTLMVRLLQRGGIIVGSTSSRIHRLVLLVLLPGGAGIKSHNSYADGNSVQVSSASRSLSIISPLLAQAH
mmetsp:Transcript_33191/g.61676  ORF Transcript_33191/g.61676 Transcript_33191/m.61676 type:complete len:206 (+) Transcript_33191:854-1471(+)